MVKVVEKQKQLAKATQAGDVQRVGHEGTIKCGSIRIDCCVVETPSGPRRYVLLEDIRRELLDIGGSRVECRFDREWMKATMLARKDGAVCAWLNAEYLPDILARIVDAPFDSDVSEPAYRAAHDLTALLMRAAGQIASSN